MEVTDTDYLVQGPNEMWQIVQEVRDYLHAYLHDPSARVYAGGGVIHYSSEDWGEVVDGGCKVSLAGLYYLKKGGVLLTPLVMGKNVVPQVADFLCDLCYVDVAPEHIEDWLSIDLPDGLYQDLAASAGIPRWEGDNPQHVLYFLDWLLEHKPMWASPTQEVEV
jgi:hypothetical protein